VREESLGEDASLGHRLARAHGHRAAGGRLLVGQVYHIILAQPVHAPMRRHEKGQGSGHGILEEGQ
jgi:hypothetical protein